MYNYLTLITFFLLIIVSFGAAFIGKVSFVFSFIWVLVAGVSLLIFRKLELKKLFLSRSKLEEEEANINVLSSSLIVKDETLHSLPQIRQKSSFLFKVSQNLIKIAKSEEIYDFLINTLGELFPQADSILFFVFDKEKDFLSLIRSLKRKCSVIKEKKGDALDKWVLHHNCSLFVEDLTKDFRFDYNKIMAYKERKAQSFIVSPISVGSRLLGIIRVENSKSSGFSLDDLRFLRNICDLGAVVIERANLFAGARDLAIKDPLTSLYLRDYFFQKLAEECKEACDKKSQIGILMIDVDDFKKINDIYGHIVGDLVLKKIAQCLRHVVGREGRSICRFGGEEFMVLVTKCNKEDLVLLGENIRKTIEAAEVTFRRRKVNFTISLGAILYSGNGENIEEIISKVDKLMYKAKQKGKNKLCFSE